MKTNNKYDSLIEFCTSNNRACPVPQKWQELYELLKNKKQNTDGSWNPSLPLILAAWHDSPPLFKSLRLQEHIKWALQNGQIDEVDIFLRSLNEDDWFKF